LTGVPALGVAEGVDAADAESGASIAVDKGSGEEGRLVAIRKGTGTRRTAIEEVGRERSSHATIAPPTTADRKCPSAPLRYRPSD
jgi:hypothetical protein